MKNHAILPLLLLGACFGAPSPPIARATDTPPNNAASPQSIRWQGNGIEVPLWPAGLAIARPEVDGPESVKVGTKLLGGKTVTGIDNVTRPTMTIYRPKVSNTGAALMVYPGGGYQGLAIDLEGTEVCDWATAIGMTCVVLKYRVPQTWWRKACGCQDVPKPFMPLQDAERAIRLLRQRAAMLSIDPNKIGVIGFSAGGHLVTAISNGGGKSYAPVDAADKLSARPNFAMPLYPGHLWLGDDTKASKAIALYPFDRIVADAPPTFMVQAQDDPTDDVRHSISYFVALTAKKVPVEMHIYATGGHAFGLRKTDEPITGWPALAETWLRRLGMI